MRAVCALCSGVRTNIKFPDINQIFFLNAWKYEECFSSARFSQTCEVRGVLDCEIRVEVKDLDHF